MTAHFKKDIIISTKKERHRVPSSTRPICRAVYSTLENII